MNQKAIKVSEEHGLIPSEHCWIPTDQIKERTENFLFVFFISWQIAWALNKGIKAEFKQYWDVELGVTYIPWSKIREVQLEELKEGGILDVDTLSPGTNSDTLYCIINIVCFSVSRV